MLSVACSQGKRCQQVWLRDEEARAWRDCPLPSLAKLGPRTRAGMLSGGAGGSAVGLHQVGQTGGKAWWLAALALGLGKRR